MPIATLQESEGRDYRLMISETEFIHFRGQTPVEVTDHIASVLRHKPNFLVIDGTMGQKAQGVPRKPVAPAAPPVDDLVEEEEQNVAGIPHQPQFDRLKGMVE